MEFWLGILFGIIVALIAIRMGFYETWILLFNLVLALYLAVFAGPAIIGMIPGLNFSSVNKFISMAITAGACFAILQSISYIAFTSRFKVAFPKIFDLIGSAFLGFLAGFLVWSFVFLLICVTPLSKNLMVRQMGITKASSQTSISYLAWWCNIIDDIASSDKKYAAQDAINNLIKIEEEKPNDKNLAKPEPNSPAEPNAKTKANTPDSKESEPNKQP